MKHKTWFRLVIRAIGVLLVGWSLPSILGATISLLLQVLDVGGLGVTRNSAISYNWPFYAGSLAQLVLGLYLFFGGTWVINKCIPSNRPYCPECGYDLSHNSQAANCPECGVTLPAQQ